MKGLPSNVRGPDPDDDDSCVSWESDKDGSNAGITLGVLYPGATIRRDGRPSWPMRLFQTGVSSARGH